MIIKENKALYKAFGLHFLSEIEMPELFKVSPVEERVDVTIVIEDLLDLWAAYSEPNRYFYVEPNLCIFLVPEVAIFKVNNGKCISISPIKGSHEDQIRLYLLGTCMGALLIQRKILPLHGSALAINGKAYAIIGESGAGKSTLAAAFLKNGYQLLSDDIVPIRLDNKGIPYIIPAYPQQKLWRESLDSFGVDTSKFRSIIKRDTKYIVPVTNQFAQEALPLEGIIELIKTDHLEIKMQPIPSLLKLRILFAHTYRNFFINPAGLLQWHFDITTKIAHNCVLSRLERPITRFTAEELTEVILTTIKKEELVHD
ncbi:ATP-binding cassette domain-containing protein [Sediminibacillus massiliensis]|uniref:ATP-binding cassette domain-containing protein n=1 Tax=Sediminibacillus massiliensis TaxID=1926277 RepID=UPI000988816D|nr:ATP-binding cassette domain-containing protein [Sediminibacillus massiliensis]